MKQPSALAIYRKRRYVHAAHRHEKPESGGAWRVASAAPDGARQGGGVRAAHRHGEPESGGAWRVVSAVPDGARQGGVALRCALACRADKRGCGGSSIRQRIGRPKAAACRAMLPGCRRRHFFQKVLALSATLCYNPIVACQASADVAQSVERILGKDEVGGSNPPISSKEPALYGWFFVLCGALRGNGQTDPDAGGAERSGTRSQAVAGGRLPDLSTPRPSAAREAVRSCTDTEKKFKRPAFCASAVPSTVRPSYQVESFRISRRRGNSDTAPRLAKLGHSAFCACMVSSMVRPSCQVESSFISRRCGVIDAAVRCTETTPLYPALAQWQPISLARPRLAYVAPFVCAGGRRTS